MIFFLTKTLVFLFPLIETNKEYLAKCKNKLQWLLNLNQNFPVLILKFTHSYTTILFVHPIKYVAGKKNINNPIKINSNLVINILH